MKIKEIGVRDRQSKESGSRGQPEQGVHESVWVLSF